MDKCTLPIIRSGLFFLFGCMVMALFYFAFTQSNVVEKNKVVMVNPHEDEILERIEILEKNMQKALMRIEELSCKTQEVGSRGGFCLSKEKLTVGGNWAWDLTMAQEIENHLEGQSIGDFGAGLGWYGRYFLRDGGSYFHTAPDVEKQYFLDVVDVQNALKTPQKIKSWKGYDGAVYVKEVTGGLVNFLDLSESFDLKERYDWILSLEVGEHIPIEFEQIFIDNLVRHACKGIILSWAVPEQGGHHHVNNRPREYVTGEMKNRGFEADEDWAEKLRSVSTLGWFRNTVMAFKRTKPLEDSFCDR